MPIAKNQYDRLPPGLCFFLARGVLPPREIDGGRVEIFELRHGEASIVRAALSRLWAKHSDEIRAATPPGTSPWILKRLATPDDAAGPDEEDA